MSFLASTSEGYSNASEKPQQPRQESQRSPKIRLSCDECAVAKVRCSKTRPVCDRCINHGLECVYGLSMKHGRGAGKRRKAAAAEAQAQSASNFDTSKTSDGLDEDWQSLCANIFAGHGQAPVAPMFAATSPTTSSSTGPSTSAHLARTPASDRNTATMDDIFSFACNTPFDLPELGDGALGNVSTELQYNHFSHDCYELAHSAMALLSFNPGSSSRESSTVDGEQGGRQRSVLNLVDVLQGTKAALSDVSDLVRCWCLSDSRMTLLCASIIMRILFWHRVIVGKASSYTSQSPSLESAIPRTDTRLGQPVSITSEPITIGNYVPDAEEQDMIHRTHLLGNLQKIENLIESFSRVGELQKTLAVSLRSELAQAMEEVGNYGDQGAVW